MTEELLPEPLARLALWLDEARRSGLHNPDAMAVATAGADGVPAVRMVLLRGLDEHGVVFYTSYDSPKAAQLAENPRAAAVLYWTPLDRQARLAGRVERVAGNESDVYFAGRPHGHRVAAWASEQSRPVASRAELEERFRVAEERFAGAEVPRPPFWGGFRIVPSELELWESRANRMHEREQWLLGADGWSARRLMP